MLWMNFIHIRHHIFIHDAIVQNPSRSHCPTPLPSTTTQHCKQQQLQVGGATQPLAGHAAHTHNVMHYTGSRPAFVTSENLTRKPSCRWQTRAMLAKILHGLRKSSEVVSYIARLPIDSMPMVSYYVLYSNCVCKMRCFGDTRLLTLPWPWNPGQGSLKVIETDTVR